MLDDTREQETAKRQDDSALSRRNILLGTSTLVAAATLTSGALLAQAQKAAPAPATAGQKPNIVVVMGDDIGWFNIGAYHQGIMSGRTPNLDKLAAEVASG